MSGSALSVFERDALDLAIKRARSRPGLKIEVPVELGLARAYAQARGGLVHWQLLRRAPGNHEISVAIGKER